MNRNITFLKNSIRFLKSKNALLFLGLIFSSFGNLFAQTYCTPTMGAGCNYGGVSPRHAIDRIRIRDLSGTALFTKAGDGCNYGATGTVGAAGTGYTHVTQSPSFSLSAGSTYNFDLSAVYNWSTTLTVYMYCWIDLNRDGNFSSSEFMSTGWSPCTSQASGAPGNFTTNTVSIPCNISPGTSRIRLLSIGVTGFINSGMGCSGTTTGYFGEIEDHSFTLALPTSLSAGFFMPTTAFTGTVVNLVNANQSGYIGHQWDIDDNGTVEYNTTNAKHIFTTSGTKFVRLKSQNCLGRDSIVKTISIVDPAFAPVADFVGDKVEIEKFGTVKFSDLSTNGPTYWNWVIWDPRDSAGTSASINSVNFNLVGGDPYVNKDPSIFFQTEGTYNVCLQTSNSKGPSAWKCKTAYLRVTPFKDITMGPIKQSFEANGNIIDNGGRLANYSNNRIDDFAIIPCQAKKIKLKFSQFKLLTGDILRVYDGFDASGTPIHKGTGFTAGSLLKDSTLVANSGAMYLYFTSNGTGNDSGFIASWSIEKGSATSPIADFQAFDTMYNNVDYTLKNISQFVLGQTDYTWTVDGVDESYAKDFQKTFYTDNKYKVCLTAKTCNGSSTYCRDINVVTPHSKAKFDFEASNRRPVTGENVNFTILNPAPDKAIKPNRWRWVFFPNTVSFVSGTNENSTMPIVKFNAKGKYTVSLKGWNNLDSALTINNVIKDQYVIVVEPCTPIIGVTTSADVAINNFTLKDAKGKELINNTSGIGNGYDDYTSVLQASNLLFGGKYEISVSRNTQINPMNRKVWVDWNIDGDFDDAGELVATESSAKTEKFTSTITVPNISSAFEGKTRIRIGTSYSNDPNNPCGASSGVANSNRIGEFEDYPIKLTKDLDIPEITIINEDTLYLQVGSTYTDFGATAFDATQGDITSDIITTSDVDMSLTGVYYITYNVKDASGNTAMPKTRVVYVVIDQTNPVLTLNGTTPMTLEVFTPYVEDGATATDNRDGSLTNSIVRTGTVNSNVVGVYTITYTVRDAQGNSTTKTRIVNIVDTQKPIISNPDADANNEVKVQIVSIFVDRTAVTDNYYNVNLIATPGASGEVDTRVSGKYPVTYTAKDGSNNEATPVIYTYIVADYVAPVIDLHSLDTVYHRVFNPYNSVSASVSDNFYNNSQISITKTSNVNTNVLGLYYDEYTATDAGGNISKKRRYIRVIDDVMPTIFGEAVCVGLYSKFDATSYLTFVDNYDKPSDIKANLKVLANNINTDKIGVYNVTYVTYDKSGNKSEPFNQIVWVNRDCDQITSGINKDQISNKINIYPNPSKGLTNIEFNFGAKLNASIVVYNALGEKVTDVINTNTNIGTYNLDLSKQSAGLYHIQIMVDGKSTTKTIQIVK